MSDDMDIRLRNAQWMNAILLAKLGGMVTVTQEELDYAAFISTDAFTDEDGLTFVITKNPASEHYTSEVEELRQWSAEAMEVLAGWDEVYDALDPADAQLGEYRYSIALRAVRDLKAKIIELEEAIRLHRTRTTGYINAQPTPEPIALADEDLYAVIKEQKQ